MHKGVGSASKLTPFFILPRKSKYCGMSRSDADDVASANDRIAKMNHSMIYTGIQAALFGGRVTHPFKSEMQLLFKESVPLQFRPDIIHPRKRGVVYTEVKTSNQKDPRFSFHENQIGLYALGLLQRLECGDYSPGVTFAFFKYCLPPEQTLNTLTPGGLARNVAQNTHSLTVIPLNLFLFAYMLGRSEDRDHSTSKYGMGGMSCYRDIPASLITVLSQQDENRNDPFIRDFSIMAFAEQYKTRLEDTYHKKSRGKLSDLFPTSWLRRKKDSLESAVDFAGEHLGLDNLQIQKFKASGLTLHPKSIGYVVQPFPVTDYTASAQVHTYTAWLNHFQCAPERILRKVKIVLPDVPF